MIRTYTYGNQYSSRKADLMELLHTARQMLRDGSLSLARLYLSAWETRVQEVPASTRRRWKCGQ